MKLSTRETRRARDAIDLARRYRQTFPVILRSGLTVREMECLLAIAIRERATATEVSDDLDRDLPSISRTMHRLRSRGLVSRIEIKGRAEPHALTDAGARSVQAFLNRRRGIDA